MNMLKIWIPENAGIFKIAAEEFASLYKKVTSKNIGITTDSEEKCDLIVLGADHENHFSHACIIDKTIPPFRLRVGTDDYELRSGTRETQKLLFIAGGSRRALLYGIYRFFELAANCRYFWDGDIIPQHHSIRLDSWEVYESPHFDYRGLRYFAHRGLYRFQAEHWNFEDWQKEIDFLLKKRFNMFMLRIGLDDLFQKAFPEQVPYPADFEIEGSIPRSYDDHTLFMPLEERGKLRKKILSYAQERGLLHPEDIGTMTHWYSRTPMDFIRAFQPSFLPQADGAYYSDPTGQVWDIRDDKNLERYYALTLAHIKHYGSPDLFHTIGLSERHCYNDHKSNHQMKLYTYRRIIGRLRKDFPNAPLMIASWEFLDWSLEEVRDLIRSLDPENTVILDYIADIQDEHNCFINWDIVGKRKWIFGIFHSNVNNSEIRGNYPLIEDRLERAAADPMCRGMVLWAETSHADTLMMEYVAANSWNPSHIRIDSFIEEFCAARYPETKEKMLELWRLALPSIKKRIRFGFKNKDASALMFFIRPLTLHTQLDAGLLRRYSNTLDSMLPAVNGIEQLFRKIASAFEDAAHSDFVCRDLFDLTKSAAASVMDTGWAAINVAMDNWRNDAENSVELKDALKNLVKALSLLADILSASKEFSLYDSLKRLEQGENRNHHFEYTLKGNAENSYSRSFIPETIRACTIPEIEVFAAYVTENLDAGHKKQWLFPESFKMERKRILDVFYNTKLEKPDFETAEKELLTSLLHFGEITEKIMVFANQTYETFKQGAFG